MNYSINPYQLKINELNKDLEGLKLDKSVLLYDLIEYSKYPVPKINLISIAEEIMIINGMIKDINYKIRTISQFINR
jgi:hypothetical protein